MRPTHLSLQGELGQVVRSAPNGRAARLSGLTKGFISEYRRTRIAEGTAPGTVNRDLTALQAFLTWCADDQGLAGRATPSTP